MLIGDFNEQTNDIYGIGMFGNMINKFTNGIIPQIKGRWNLTLKLIYIFIPLDAIIIK